MFIDGENTFHSAVVTAFVIVAVNVHSLSSSSRSCKKRSYKNIISHSLFFRLIAEPRTVPVIFGADGCVELTYLELQNHHHKPKE